jgi:AAA domain, putative AbiEii toxin, Type IV TA system/AAA domain/NACHT domain/Restriction endonuclease
MLKSSNRPVTEMGLINRVVEVYRLLGWEVNRLTFPQNRAFDLIVTRDVPGLGRSSYLVECKARRVDLAELQGLRGALRRQTGGTIKGGVLVTDGTFSPEVLRATPPSKDIVCFALSELEQQALKIQPYLNSIIHRFEQRFPHMCYMELRATEFAIVGSRAKREAASNVVDLLKKWLKRRDKKFLFLVGGPGSGKSSVCSKFARDLALTKGARIPFLVSANLVRSSPSITSAILRTVSSDVEFNKLAALLDSLNSRGEILLMIDGVDEIPGGFSAIQSLLVFADQPTAKVILTCREPHFDSSLTKLMEAKNSTVLVLADLDDSQIETYLKVRLEPGKRDIVRSSLQSLPNLAGSPLLLELLTQFILEYQTNDALSISAIMERLIVTLLRRERRELEGLSLEAELDILSNAAFNMFVAGVERLPEDLFGVSFAQGAQRLESSSLLIREPSGYYTFANRSFQDFFVARYLTLRISDESPAVFGRVVLSSEILRWLADLAPPIKILRKWLREIPDSVNNQAFFQENMTALCQLLDRPALSRIPRLRIRELQLSNIKCFENATFSFSHDRVSGGVTLMIGDNGVGKSTALQAIALCALGPEIASKLVPLPDRLLRHGAEQGFLQATFDVWGLGGETESRVVVGLTVKRGSRQIALVRQGPFASKNAERLLEARSQLGFAGLFVAGYGASRNLQFVEDPRRSSPKDPLIDTVESLFDSGAARVFEPRSLARLVIGDGTPFREYGAPPTLEPVVRESIGAILTSLLPEGKEQRFNANGEYVGWFGATEIEQLSEGYRSTLAWAGHLIVQLLSTSLWSKTIEAVSGLVLIDELDLHLHPQWQRVIVERLRLAFPNVQFVATTHSPLVVADAEANPGAVFLLREENGKAVVDDNVPSVNGWRADQILASLLFGYLIERDPRTENALKEASILAGKGNRRSEKEEARYEELMAALESTRIATGQTLIERELQDRNRRRVSELTERLEAELFPGKRDTH